MLKFIIRKALIHLRREEEGQTLVEYALLLALIAIVVIAALIVLGPIVSEIFTDIGDKLDGAGDGNGNGD